MVREMGAKGACVREVFSADLEMLDQMPKRIFGLILLLRYREVDTENQEEECPEHVWFANQLPGQNSCGTLAMINILMNVDDIELGEHLQQFKEFTDDFTPYQRGMALTSFDFVKKIHNSFATKMDMLQNDIHLATKAKKGTNTKRRNSKDTIDSNTSNDSLEENAHHFIAMTPKDGQVWKLDGMDCNPTSIGDFDEENYEEWLTVALTRIKSLMSVAGDADYTLLAVCQSPVMTLRKEYCQLYATMKLVEQRLDDVDETWRSFLVTDGEDPSPEATSPTFLGITQEMMASTEVPPTLKSRIQSEQMLDLLDRREVLVKKQQKIPDKFFAESNQEEEEDQKARERRWDYSQVVKKWLEMLAENGYLEQNLDRFMRGKK